MLYTRSQNRIVHCYVGLPCFPLTPLKINISPKRNHFKTGNFHLRTIDLNFLCETWDQRPACWTPTGAIAACSKCVSISAFKLFETSREAMAPCGEPMAPGDIPGVGPFVMHLHHWKGLWSCWRLIHRMTQRSCCKVLQLLKCVKTGQFEKWLQDSRPAEAEQAFPKPAVGGVVFCICLLLEVLDFQGFSGVPIVANTLPLRKPDWAGKSSSSPEKYNFKWVHVSASYVCLESRNSSRKWRLIGIRY